MRSIVLSASLAAILFFFMAFAWRFVGPSYNRALVAVAGQLGSDVVGINSEKMEIVLQYQGNRKEENRRWRVQGPTLHYGPLLVTALILATPACGWRRKITWVSVTWLGFLTLHVGFVALLSWSMDWTAEGGPITLDRLRLLLPVIYMLLPALVAAAWCSIHWLPRTGRRSPRPIKTHLPRSY